MYWKVTSAEKKCKGGEHECWGGGQRAVKGHLLEQVTFAGRLEGGESGKLGGNPGMGTTQCTVLEAGQDLAYLRTSKDVGRAGEGRADEALEQQGLSLMGCFKDFGISSKRNEELPGNTEERREGIPFLYQVFLVASGEPQSNAYKLACSPLVPFPHQITLPSSTNALYKMPVSGQTTSPQCP